jgi:hypothetical protein
MDKDRAIAKNQETEGASSSESKLEVEHPSLLEKAMTLQERENAMDRREAELRESRKALEAEKEELRRRKKALQEAEIIRDQGYADERKKLDDEFFAKQKTLGMELSALRVNGMEELRQAMSKEREQRLAALEKELAAERVEHKAGINAEKDELTRRKNELQQAQEELAKKSGDLAVREMTLNVREETIGKKSRAIDEEVARGIVEQKKSFDMEKAGLQNECERLRENIRTSNDLLGTFDELKRKLGNEAPEAVLQRLKTYEEVIKELKKELLERPTKEMQTAFDNWEKEREGLKQACERLSEENVRLRNEKREQTGQEMRVVELEDENRRLMRVNESIDADNNRLVELNNRLRSVYERTEEQNDRIKNIEDPYFKEIRKRAVVTKTVKEDGKNLAFLINGEGKEKDEIVWLNEIGAKCAAYGLRFHPRILYAYHTALKTAEWSPLTVLAGVSGTGKSELPRLYAHFGGINFLSVPVQPNWDSQESMLGFFNSIDNKFDAQPILKLLVQSQKDPSNNYPEGLNDVLTLILLDEMNLAHVELYFAEFLSKLELRRGTKMDELPTLDVKLGSGIPQPYKLPLGRNVLWSGTMNQDETTKSLSDKVLDRGIIISFPRPTVLERRKKLNPLGQGEFEAAALLPKSVWQSWRLMNSSFDDAQIKPYKEFIEQMNNSLSKVGRALGHRIWQSVEYYMTNYPTVIKAKAENDESKLKTAMRTAFEDQLVQKVMPKLRGIETRGKAKTECLDKIRAQLDKDNYTIVEDFDLACEFGYGQFIWNSANYLKEEDTSQEAREANTEKEDASNG